MVYEVIKSYQLHIPSYFPLTDSLPSIRSFLPSAIHLFKDSLPGNQLLQPLIYFLL